MVGRAGGKREEGIEVKGKGTEERLSHRGFDYCQACPLRQYYQGIGTSAGRWHLPERGCEKRWRKKRGKKLSEPGVFRFQDTEGWGRLIW